jgi:ABC-type branched-subunit amino acid transport system ATPase component
VTGTELDHPLAVQVDSLTKHYGKLLAVDQVSFEAKQGYLWYATAPVRTT